MYKPISVSRCRPQIPHELSSYLTGPSAVRGWTQKDVLVGCFFCFVSGCSGTYTALQCYNCDLLCKIALTKHSPSFLVSKCRNHVLCSACVCATNWLLRNYYCSAVALHELPSPMCRPHSVRHVTHTCQVEYIEFCAKLSRRNLTGIIYVYIYIYTYVYILILLPLAVQPVVGFALSNNVLPFFTIWH